MKARRLIPVVLCFLLLWSGGALAAATPPGELPIVTEPVTLTIGTRAMPTVTDYDANALTNLIREKSGVDIQIVPFDNVGNCDAAIFLDGKEKTTLEEWSKMLGKETIHTFTNSETRGNAPSYGRNYARLGKDLMSVGELAVLDDGKYVL